MLLREINAFFENADQSSTRRTQMVGALSPAARHEILITSGLQFGEIRVFIDPKGIAITVTAECSVPLIGWWNYEGDVTITSSGASITACELISVVKRSWSHSRICRVELKHQDEVEVKVQEKILHSLSILRHDLVDLRLENFYLSANDALPAFNQLRSIFLTGFSGPVQSWSEALNSSAERVEICDTTAFTTESFSYLEDNTLYRLILDNTNVAVSNLDQLKCARALETLSLIDCRKINSFDAASFPELRVLLLGRTPISSDTMTGIETCRHLKLINLGGCREITDINVLGKLKEIREIFVHETNVTNDGIVGLTGCENLEKLNLGGCRHISDVNHLGCLTALKELHLWSTKVSNQGIHGLCHCSSLTELVLDDCTRITDVTSLGWLPSLRWLSLLGTEVNSDGIKELIHCRNIETLALAGTRVDRPPKLWRHEAIMEYLSKFQ
ncbi:hypothetical protein ABB37_03159 [Leptomonas pyrrhocoris]|uniref:Uncharacterized protein n=1 Tax=Leptomonas pyrrhocoris TaxID=157538 RepID=A0A0N0DWL9_LEPPY|nr:hypothetical protein ABB37_03159 [Leptomonas pyrrhocoris]KPA81975.1 hypothetical protein ABB37_03159 [Leptomonas pyrrhocoris]|eukprot:XP_015660414.1 hypothetical protein ABB37_03159 [Leptomonas pyrrhocoris]